MKEEIWKVIPGFNRYEASSLGNIRTLNWKKSGRTVVMKPAISKKGYLTTVMLNNEGEYKNVKVHRMVAFAFLGVPDDLNLTVNHINRIKSDNRPENLEYLTRIDNSRDAWNNGMQKWKGEDNNFSKLTEKQVLEIREKFIPFIYTKQQLAEEYGVKIGTIKNVILRRTWTHI